MEQFAIECNELVKVFKTSKLGKIKNENKDIVAVNKLSFQVKRGEIYGLLGPNGAGKTTTLRILATLIKPDSGIIIMNGSKMSFEEIRKRIGFLTDELHLEDCFSADFYYDYFGSLYGLSDEEIKQRKNEIFARLGINRFKDMKYGELSTGMKQKVSLAVSIVHNPEIIIFDEPTNGLDIVAAKTVVDFIKEMKKSGKTIILSTHIFSLVEDVCDRVGIINNGKMVEVYDVPEILKNSSIEEKFFEVYKESSNETISNNF